VCAGVADNQPQHLGWRTPQKAQATKIVILGDDGVPTLLSKGQIS
jgi:hypothetical protein